MGSWHVGTGRQPSRSPLACSPLGQGTLSVPQPSMSQSKSRYRLCSQCKDKLLQSLLLQWNLQIKDTLGLSVVSLVERMSSSQRFQNDNGNSYFWDI